jgi:hypothetical protein
MESGNNATWVGGGSGENATVLWVKLGNGHLMAVTVFTGGRPPEIVLCGLEDYRADTFRAWLAAAAAEPLVMAD